MENLSTLRASHEQELSKLKLDHKDELDRVYTTRYEEGRDDTLAEIIPQLEEFARALQKSDVQHAKIVLYRLLNETKSTFIIGDI